MDGSYLQSLHLAGTGRQWGKPVGVPVPGPHSQHTDICRSCRHDSDCLVRICKGPKVMLWGLLVSEYGVGEVCSALPQTAWAKREETSRGVP